MIGHLQDLKGGHSESRMFQFTPLLGAQSASPASQSLLELDGGVKILIDVGWDDDFDVEKLNELERWVTCEHCRAFRAFQGGCEPCANNPETACML